MKIVVLVKDVPDTYGTRTLNPETGLADRSSTEQVMDEINERALEVALRYADRNPDVEVRVLTMGPPASAETARRSLAIGANSAVIVTDDRLAGADLGLTAEVLAAALARMGFDLVMAGNRSTDGSGGVVPAMIAELLDIPCATALNTVDISPDAVSGERVGDGPMMSVTATLPAIVSVTERLPEARFPSLKGTMAAKRKPLDELTLDDLGIEPENAAASRSIVLALSETPPHGAGVKIVDDGDAGLQLADFLVDRKLA
ncbi:MAG TPA: electron transfer flavoprotein subunit beta/FixA family protein [Galbitalea sp.]|nr:electron transfer flavoprotein subunit beta/FixA family protein [Galbitalea sp.]